PRLSQIYTLSLHDALPIFRLDTALLEASENRCMVPARVKQIICLKQRGQSSTVDCSHAKKPLALLVVLRAGQLSEEEKGLQQERSEEHTSELQSPYDLVCR